MDRSGYKKANPDWNRLYATASSQNGYFTTAQASEAGYSLPLLSHYVKIGRIVRIRRGIHRLVHFPESEQEELTIIWLWSEKAGVFSHETALSLHGLSDILPAKLHITLPSSWKNRRLRVPTGVVLHFADLSDTDKGWSGAVQATNPKRTINDCIEAHASPETIAQAIVDARRRGLISIDDTDELNTIRNKAGM